MKNTTAIGLKAEALAAEYLASIGYSIIERNYRNRFSEIDIIAQNVEYICFVEVKYRSNSGFGGGLSAISKDKQRRLRNAAQYWLSINPQPESLQPRLDVISVDGQAAIEHILDAVN
jgi:putative endonuclease